MFRAFAVLALALTLTLPAAAQNPREEYRPDPKTMSRQHIARISRNSAGGIDETPVCPSRLQALLPGEALAL